jgi:hypothetical protein
LDARNRPLFKAKHNLTDDKLQKRFYFDVTTVPPVLKISPVLIEDEGDYRCRVDYRKTRTQNVFSTLRVIGIVKFEYQNNIVIENIFIIGKSYYFVKLKSIKCILDSDAV